MKKRYALTYFLDADYKAMEDWLNRKEDRGWELERLRLGLLAVFAVAVAYLVKGTYNPFIYFNF